MQQYHDSSKLGQVTLNKNEVFGPHVHLYQIHIHWKEFKERKQEFCIPWVKKLIKLALQKGRGCLTKVQQQTKVYQQWRQKRDGYYSNSFEKLGGVRVIINLENKEITVRADCKRWMQGIFKELISILARKCITNNRVEIKHSQIKWNGNLKKQTYLECCDK